MTNKNERDNGFSFEASLKCYIMFSYVWTSWFLILKRFLLNLQMLYFVNMPTANFAATLWIIILVQETKWYHGGCQLLNIKVWPWWFASYSHTNSLFSPIQKTLCIFYFYFTIVMVLVCSSWYGLCCSQRDLEMVMLLGWTLTRYVMPLILLLCFLFVSIVLGDCICSWLLVQIALVIIPIASQMKSVNAFNLDSVVGCARGI